MIRLGEFGKGFLTGFAEEANEALKNDIQRINTRLKKLLTFVSNVLSKNKKNAKKI